MLNRYLGSALGLAVLLAGSAMATTPALPPEYSAFRLAYRMSYFGFDVCGDTADGKLYRKALAEKVEHCPFTPAVKADFRHWSVEADIFGAADVQRYIAEHDKLPERLDEKRVACRKEQATPAYQKTIALLAGYGKGEVPYDAVVPDACDTKAGGP